MGVRRGCGWRCERGSGSVRRRCSRWSSAAAARRRSSCWPSAHLGAPGNALARVVLPRFAGKIDAVAVRSAERHGGAGDAAGRRRRAAGHRRQRRALAVELTVRRPGWAAWLVGDIDRRTFTVETPSAHLLGRWLQVRPGGPVTVAFDTAGQPRLARRASRARRLAHATGGRADRAGRERDARHRRGRRRRGRAHLGAAVRGRARQLVPGAALPAAARRSPRRARRSARSGSSR